MGTDSQFENDYVREHAEPYNQSRPTSPSSLGHARARSIGSTRSRNRSGTIGKRPEPISRPSTANGTRKPSLADISRGPKPALDERPPMPSKLFGLTAPRAIPRPSGYGGLDPDLSQAGDSADQAMQRRQLSPSRSQTFPLHNENRTSGTGPNGFIARRPSEPSPMLPTGKPTPVPDTTSSRSVQGSSRPSLSNNPPKQSSPPRANAGIYPSRDASRTSNTPSRKNRPFPVRSASRSDIRFNPSPCLRRHQPAILLDFQMRITHLSRTWLYLHSLHILSFHPNLRQIRYVIRVGFRPFRVRQ
jgi:hypothetical protein